jgi:hypothetical protein
MTRHRTTLLFGITVLVLGCVPDERPAPVEPLPEGRYAMRLGDPAVAGLPADSRTELAASPLRMLVLPAAYAASSVVMVGEHWCAVARSGDGMTITIHATDHFRDPPEGAEVDLDGIVPTATVRGIPAWESDNDAIHGISWTEADVAYALEVECEDPLGDVRCTGAAFIEELASGLVEAHDGEYGPGGRTVVPGIAPAPDTLPVLAPDEPLVPTGEATETVAPTGGALEGGAR